MTALTDDERREALAAMADRAKKWRHSRDHMLRDGRRDEYHALGIRLLVLNAARRKLSATIDEEDDGEIAPDTDRPLTGEWLGWRYVALFRPTEHEEVPLTVDPDDYPVVEDKPDA